MKPPHNIPRQYYKRANSLFVSTQDQSAILFVRSKYNGVRIRSHSNEIKLNASDLNNFIKEKESLEVDADDNLTNMAKVILIEQKRSLEMTQTQDSSLSFTPPGSTGSRRDSVSFLIRLVLDVNFKKFNFGQKI